MTIVLINEVPTEVGNGADEIIRLRTENARLHTALTAAIKLIDNYAGDPPKNSMQNTLKQSDHRRIER